MTFVNSAPDVRTYVAQMDVKPEFGKLKDNPSLVNDPAALKVAAVELQRNAESAVFGTVANKLESLKAEGLVTSYEYIPLTGSLVINTPEANSSAAWEAIRGVEELGRIQRDREVQLDTIMGKDVELGGAVGPEHPAKFTWNVEKVNAPAAWEAGVLGHGVVVGIVDTGGDVNHDALKAKYRGTTKDGSFDHNYNFFDAINGKTESYDDHGHGSHVAGTVLGSTATIVTGMAPSAKFISAKAFSSRGSGSTSGILKALSWMLAPTDSKGENPDPTKAPDIINNSWGSRGFNSAYLPAFQAFTAAGIIPVASAGNSGRGDRSMTIGSPGAYPDSVTVAATDKDDKRAYFSSVGPSQMKDKNGRYIDKPDVTAPGHKVISVRAGGGYREMSGTSMSSPAVAGVIALLKSKYRNMTIDDVKSVLGETAVDLGKKGYDYFNGHGRVDVAKALELAEKRFGAKDPKKPDPKS